MVLLQSIRLQMTDKQAVDPTIAKCLNALYPNDRNDRKQLSLGTDSSLSLPKSPSKSKIKMVQYKKQDHSIRNVLIFTFIIIAIILCIDLRNGIDTQLHKLQIQASNCFNEHALNECHDPVDILREKCKELQVCYSTPANKNVKVTEILGNLVGKAVKNLTSSAGVLGTVFLLVLICAIFYFAYKSSRAEMIVKHD